MKIVRKSFFDTNSSSTHSIHIDCNSLLDDTLVVDEDGTCYIYTGEFGWEVKNYYDAITKASYVATYIRNLPKFEHYQEFPTQYYDILENDPLFIIFSTAIKEVTGATKVKIMPSDKSICWNYGYIDHQSLDEYGEPAAIAPAFESVETMKAFLFSKKSRLHTDNDNH